METGVAGIAATVATDTDDMDLGIRSTDMVLVVACFLGCSTDWADGVTVAMADTVAMVTGIHVMDTAGMADTVAMVAMVAMADTVIQGTAMVAMETLVMETLVMERGLVTVRMRPL